MQLPAQNFIIYDADCGFCESSVARLRKILGDRIAYVPRQSLGASFYNIADGKANQAIRFFEHHQHRGISAAEQTIHYNYLSIYPDAKIYSAAYAIFKALSYVPQWKFLLWCYLYLPLFAVSAEAVYAVISRYRSELSSACRIS